MKKKVFCLAAALCLLLLCACGQRPDSAEMSLGSGVALLTAQTEPTGDTTKLEKVAFGLIALAIGIFIVVKPRAAWHLSHGRKYRHVEPSKLSLIMEYVVGAVVIAAGVGFLLL